MWYVASHLSMVVWFHSAGQSPSTTVLPKATEHHNLNHTHWSSTGLYSTQLPPKRLTSQSMTIEYNSTQWLLSIKGKIPHEVNLHNLE